MMKKKNKLSDKITEHTSDVIFGILSGSGLMFITSAIITIITLIAPLLQPYFIIMYAALYLFILVSTSILYAKGWFRTIYIISASILLLAYIYSIISGGV